MMLWRRRRGVRWLTGGSVFFFFLFFCYSPRLSAAMTTPPLNLTATTEVPVTIGEEVCVVGPEVWRYEWSYLP